MKKQNAKRDGRAAPEARAAESRLAPPDSQLTEGRVLFVVVALTVLVYANSLGGQFLFDDLKQIITNQDLRSWSNVLKAFTSDVWSFQRGTLTTDIPPPYYRPLFTVYLTAGYQLFGLWEPGWHLLNLLVHAGATVLVFRLVRRLGGDALTAGLAALLFGLHPAHVESVSWISGVPDPLAALFYLPAFIWFIRYRLEGGTRRLVLSLAAYALSLLCKETAIVLPAVLAVWEFARADEGAWAVRLKRAALSCAPYVAVAAVYLLVRFAVLGLISWKHPMMGQVPDSAFTLTVPYVLASYLQHLLAPFYLSLIYGTTFVRDAADARFLLPALSLAALLFALWRYRRRLSASHLTALALLFAPLLPVLNLRVFHQEYLIQDRYLYLPSVGFCFLAALLIARLSRSKPTWARAAAALLVVAYGASTVSQNRVWNDGVGLWSRAVAYAPDAWSTHYNLGLAYMDDRDYAKAREEFQTAARFGPQVAAVYNNLALATDKLGDEAGAASALERALALDPNLLEAHNNLGTILFRRGDHAQARKHFETVLARDPASDSTRFNLARVLDATGDHAGAAGLYEAVLSRNPGDTEARYHLGLSYAAQGRKPDALAQLERALAAERGPERAAEMRAKLEELRSDKTER
jgi:tetratricopeptide (TPR) repeat protein